VDLTGVEQLLAKNREQQNRRSSEDVKVMPGKICENVFIHQQYKMPGKGKETVYHMAEQARRSKIGQETELYRYSTKHAPARTPEKYIRPTYHQNALDSSFKISTDRY